VNVPVHIDAAKPEELRDIQRLLDDARLPSEDIGEHLSGFVVARSSAGLAGAAACEIHGDQGFLRSFVVVPALRNQGIGKRLLDAVVAMARSRGVCRLGLLTETAERFFHREGFTAIPRERVPPYIRETTEYRIYCPASSICMVKDL
jgi:N-acetylglutamate synthase-like GNAT family acetyltransferase